MAITYGDHLIDSGYHDITPEQERELETEMTVNSAPHHWLEQNCRMRPDGIWFDNDGNWYRPATEDDAQYGHNDTWPGDPIPVAKPDNDLLDQAVAFAEMWGTEENWPHVRDGYVAAILRERAAVQQAERADLVEALAKAGNRLSYAAQTTGGVAGRDEGLVLAIAEWTIALAALQKQER